LFGSLATFFGGIAYTVGRFLFPLSEKKKGGELVDAGKKSDIPKGGAKKIFVDNKPVLIIQPKSGDFRAFSAICTHLGCIVDWETKKNRFFCPCHAGVFDSFGNVISGPPPRPLPRYEVKIEGEKVLVGEKV
jgi:cytochrome b6-f complex iron-sulfur subunit